MNFNYTVDDFESLTPTQAVIILETKRKSDLEKYSFFQDQIRLINFYNVKTSMAKTTAIREPRHLYQLANEKPVKKNKKAKLTSVDYQVIKNEGAFKWEEGI